MRGETGTAVGCEEAGRAWWRSTDELPKLKHLPIFSPYSWFLSLCICLFVSTFFFISTKFVCSGLVEATVYSPKPRVNFSIKILWIFSHFLSRGFPTQLGNSPISQPPSSNDLSPFAFITWFWWLYALISLFFARKFSPNHSFKKILSSFSFY